jgi:hypothetical protein
MFAQFARFLVVVLICCGAYAQENQTPVSQAPSSTTTTDSVPHLIRFSGTVKDVAGKPVSGLVGITFALYADQNGGAALWLETQNVQADASGHYTVSLGATTPPGIPTDMFNSGEARWLGIQPDGQAEQPRVLLLSVPYALKAGDAATIGGLPPSAFVRANSDGTSPGSENSSSTETPSSPLAQTGLAATKNETVTTVGGKSGFLPLWTGTTVIGNSVLSESGSDVTLAGNLFLQKGNLNVGEGQLLGQTGFFQSGNGTQVLSATQTGNTGNGLEGISEANEGAGVYGSGVTGVSGVGLTNNSTGVSGQGGSAGTGVSGKGNFGVFGNGGYMGVQGQTSSTTELAAGVEGLAFGNGLTFGVAGLNSSTTNFSVGVAGNAGTSGVVFGVSGNTESPNGVGVYGEGVDESNTGSNLLGCCAFGVWGDTGSTFPASAALIGTADDARAIFLENNSTNVPTAFMQQDAPGQFALMAGGGQSTNSCTINTAGALSCPGGTAAVALIDSGQRQVALYGVQSPQHWFEDFGSGQLTSGAVTVSLDPTFAETVNVSDYHVFLTPKGDCRGLYVSKTTPTGFEVRELGGGQSSVAFDYRIVALRRGFESVRMEDMTERLAKAAGPMPRGRSAGRRIPRPVAAVHLAANAGTLATTPSTR